MLAVVGTVPDADFPLVEGEVTFQDRDILIQGRRVNVNRGTPALLAAAVKAAQILGRPGPVGFLVGDIGRGDGSRRLYEYLTGHLAETGFQVMTFHYLQPDVDWHNRVLFAVNELNPRPVLVADAGFMYAAKMSGQAPTYDLFTPDIGELAFLADEEAPHPFYTRGFILHEENQAPNLIARAYAHRNAARHLLVKGRRDYLAGPKGIIATIDRPNEEALEAMGGTGDTLTGLVSVLIEAGYEVGESAVMAAQVNRLAGRLAEPTPASQVAELIEQIPRALEDILQERKEKTN
ncbi:MAG: NAD(P)H-hydrate dehydratase [Thermodesulfobacteriota bacterium]|nr:NAD(P)H-hydrate dehydratase [Thermodesulfobacteriota bacterium]